MQDGTVAEQRHIESNIGTIPFLVQRERGIGSLQQPGLLAREHGIGRFRKAFARFYFDKHQRCLIRDNKVDFACPSAQTLRKNAETLGLPDCGDRGFGGPAPDFGSLASGAGCGVWHNAPRLSKKG
jgi:hypothetical protein